MVSISPATLCSFAWLDWNRAMIVWSRHTLYKTLVTTHGTITVPAIAAISLFPILLA